MTYEAKFDCPFCGKIDLSDKEVEKRLLGDTLGSCPRCGKMSYAATIRAKFKVNTKGWRGVYGSIKEVDSGKSN